MLPLERRLRRSCEPDYTAASNLPMRVLPNAVNQDRSIRVVVVEERGSRILWIDDDPYILINRKS